MVHRAPRRVFGRTGLIAACLLGSLVVTGCTPDADPGPTAPSSSSSTMSPAPPTTSGSAPEETSPPSFQFTDAMDRTFTVYSSTAAKVEAGSVVTFVTVRLHAPSESALLVAPRGSTWEIFADASAVLREPDADPGVVGGLLVPDGLDADGARIRARMAVSQNPVPNAAENSAAPSGPAATEGSSEPVTTVEVWVEPRTATVFPVEVRLDLGVTALERVAWAEDLEGGRSLRVFPTGWGRSGSQAAVVAVWDGVVGLEPEAETEVMHKQLRCHALGAANKPSWNLEPWRPDVSYLDYLLSGCNPV